MTDRNVAQLTPGDRFRIRERHRAISASGGYPLSQSYCAACGERWADPGGCPTSRALLLLEAAEAQLDLSSTRVDQLTAALSVYTWYSRRVLHQEQMVELRLRCSVLQLLSGGTLLVEDVARRVAQEFLSWFRQAYPEEANSPPSLGKFASLAYDVRVAEAAKARVKSYLKPEGTSWPD